jgi:hypothetical protein
LHESNCHGGRPLSHQSVVVSVACAAALSGRDWPVADASAARVMHACCAMTDDGHELENPEA